MDISLVTDRCCVCGAELIFPRRAIKSTLPGERERLSAVIAAIDDEIKYLESIDRTPYAEGSLAAYKELRKLCSK